MIRIASILHLFKTDSNQHQSKEKYNVTQGQYLIHTAAAGAVLWKNTQTLLVEKRLVDKFNFDIFSVAMVALNARILQQDKFVFSSFDQSPRGQEAFVSTVKALFLGKLWQFTRRRWCHCCFCKLSVDHRAAQQKAFLWNFNFFLDLSLAALSFPRPFSSLVILKTRLPDGNVLPSVNMMQYLTCKVPDFSMTNKVFWSDDRFLLREKCSVACGKKEQWLPCKRRWLFFQMWVEKY